MRISFEELPERALRPSRTLSLHDWGRAFTRDGCARLCHRSNVLAVALGTTVYLWNASTNHIQLLMRVPSACATPAPRHSGACRGRFLIL